VDEGVAPAVTDGGEGVDSVRHVTASLSVSTVLRFSSSGDGDAQLKVLDSGDALVCSPGRPSAPA
jgi:hypothetical protein